MFALQCLKLILIVFTKMCMGIWFQREYQTVSFTSNKKFFGANALGVPDNESQKGVKNLIQKDFTNFVNRKILTSESGSKYTFIRLLIGYGYVLNFMGKSTNIRTYCISSYIFS